MNMNSEIFRSRFIFIILVILLFIVLLLQISWIQRIGAVIIRNILLVILPLFDWTQIYYSDCIITNPFYVPRILTKEDCKICESLETLQRTENSFKKVSYESLLQEDRPFIVVDGTLDWKVTKMGILGIDNITKIYLSEKYEDFSPCGLTTNLEIPKTKHEFKYFLNEILNESTQNWFGHWENCNKKASKALRRFYQRPYFVPNVVDFSGSNWVLLSFDYSSDVYKSMKLEDELVCLMQIRGWNRIRVVPRQPCDATCPALKDIIHQHEILVFNGWLWKLEYIPGEKSENFAVVIGGTMT